MPACRFGAVGVGAGEDEDPVRVLAERGPRLLPVDHIRVAVADGGGAHRREIRTGLRLGEALAPPDVHVGGRREEAFLELLGPEPGDHRSDHAGVERQRLRHARQPHLVGPDLPLQGRPVLAAPLDGPVGHGQTVFVHDPLRGHHVVGQLELAVADPGPNVCRNLGGEELPQLVAERGFVVTERKLHCRTSESAGPRPTISATTPERLCLPVPGVPGNAPPRVPCHQVESNPPNWVPVPDGPDAGATNASRE